VEHAVDLAQSTFQSAFAEALHGRKLGVRQESVHSALIGYSVLYRRLQRSLKRSIMSVQEYENRRSVEGWRSANSGSASDHLYDFLEAVYVSAELFEFYESDVVKLLGLSSKLSNKYKNEIKKLKRFSTVLCNKFKHNHAFFQGVEVVYDNGNHVSGFALYMMNGQTALPSKEFHTDSTAVSLNWGLRRIVVDLLRADNESAILISGLPDKGSETLTSVSYTLPILYEAKQISTLPTVGMPMEDRSVTLKFDRREEVTVLIGEPAIYQGSGKMTAYIDLISPSLSFALPYVTGNSSIGLTAENDPNRPLPPFLRAIYNDIQVFDAAPS
jgi:hypothetical protein